MNIPVNGQITMSKTSWVEIEALSRFYGDSHKLVVESAVGWAVSNLLSNPDFVAILQEVRREGVVRGKGKKKVGAGND